MGDRTRLALLQRLSDGRMRSISALVRDGSLTRQAITKHLDVLESAGLVSSKRIGRESQYVLLPQPIARARDYLDSVSAQWDQALSRLKGFVEDK